MYLKYDKFCKGRLSKKNKEDRCKQHIIYLYEISMNERFTEIRNQ